jgi:hypothetical protein
MHADARLISRRARGFGVLAAVVLGASAMSSCGGSSGAGASDVTVLEVELGRFVIVPPLLTAPAGNLELHVTNVDDSMVHNLVVAGKGTKQLEPGQSQTLPMGEIVAGEYRMWCDMPGHAQAGQTGVLSIEPAPAAQATTDTGA